MPSITSNNKFSKTNIPSGLCGSFILFKAGCLKFLLQYKKPFGTHKDCP